MFRTALHGLLLCVLLSFAPASAQNDCGTCPEAIGQGELIQPFPMCSGKIDPFATSWDVIMSLDCVPNFERMSAPPPPPNMGSALGKNPPPSCIFCFWWCDDIIPITTQGEGHDPVCPVPPGCTFVSSFTVGMACDDIDSGKNSNAPEGAKDPDGDGIPNVWDVDPKGDGGESEGLNKGAPVPPAIQDDPAALEAYLENELGIDVDGGALQDLKDFVEGQGVNFKGFVNDDNGNGTFEWGELVNGLIDVTEIGGALFENAYDFGGFTSLDSLFDALSGIGEVAGLAAGLMLATDKSITTSSEGYQALRGVEAWANDGMATIVEAKFEFAIDAAGSFVVAAFNMAKEAMGSFFMTMFDPSKSIGSGFTIKDNGGVDLEFPWQEVPISTQSGASQVGDPVSTRDGSFEHESVDLFLPGKGLDLAIRRVYRSRTWRSGWFGPKWFVPLLEAHIKVWPGTQGDPQLLSLDWGRGYHSGFYQDSSLPSLYVGVGSEFGAIQEDTGQFPSSSACEAYPETNPGSGVFRGFVYRKATDGTLYFFCPPAWVYGAGKLGVSYLRMMVDPEGNAIRFHRNSWGGVTSIEDSKGRVIFIGWDEEKQLITSITDPEGKVTDFTYETETDPEKWGKRSTLIRVDYPKTEYYDESSNTVVEGRPFEAYTYQESPEGFQNNPDPILNYNLTQIDGPGGPKVQIQYDSSATYDFGRVISHTVAGKTATFRYEAVTNDPYGDPDVVHRTLVRWHDGEIEDFYHGTEGELLRKETWNGRFDSQEQLIAGTDDPNGPTAWLTTYSYNDDFMVTGKLLTTSDHYPSGQKMLWVYDENSPFRSRQGHVLQVIQQKDASYPGPASLATTFTYDPVLGLPRTSTDSLGRVTATVFGHQELDFSEIQALETVAGWNVLADTLASEPAWTSNDVDLFDQDGDQNGDGVRGGTQLAIRYHLPAVDVADPDGVNPPVQVTADVQIQRGIGGEVAAYKNPSGAWMAIEYGADQNPVKLIRDVGGLDLTWEFRHDLMGRMTEVRHPDGQSLRSIYSGADKVLETRWVAAGSSQDSGSGLRNYRKGPGAKSQTGGEIAERYFYDLAGRIIGGEARRYVEAGEPITDSPRLNQIRRYDAAGNIIELEERVYDAKGNLKDQGTWYQAYDGRSQPVRLDHPFGGIKTYRYDSRGLLVATSRTDSVNTDYGTTGFTYDRYANLFKVTEAVDSNGDFQNDEVQFLHDGYGRILEETSAVGVRTTFNLDDLGRPLDVTVRDDQSTIVAHQTFTHDAWDRMTRVQIQNFELQFDGTVVPVADPAWVDMEIGYGLLPTQPLWSRLDPQGENLIVRHKYDALGRRRALWQGFKGGDPLDKVGIRYNLDAMGRPTRVVQIHDGLSRSGPLSPSKSITQLRYDGHGRVTKIIDPENNVMQAGYHASGDLAWSRDPRGKIKSFAYDSWNRLTRERESGPDGLTRKISMEYNLLGDLSAFVDASQERTSYTYDLFGRHKKTIHPDLQEREHFYDAKDRILSTDLPGGITLNYAYDAVNRLRNLNAPGADGASSVTRIYEYNALGGLAKADELGHLGVWITTKRSYSSLGILLSEDQLGERFQMTTDGAGQRRDLLYPSGFHVSVQRDEIGRIRRIDGPGGMLASYSQPYGNFRYRQVDYGNGTSQVREFHPRGLAAWHELRDAGQKVLQGQIFSYDAAGNLIDRSHSLSGVQEQFQYDGFDRLTQWDYDTQGMLGSPRTMARDYDLTDNLKTITDSEKGSITVQANSRNQYTSFTPDFSQISYNARAEQTTRTGALGDEAWTWDALGRATSFSKPIGGGDIEGRTFVYDGFDRLIQVHETFNGVLVETTSLSHFEGHLLSVTKSGGRRDLVYGMDDRELLYRDLAGVGEYFKVDPFHNVEGIFTAGMVESYSYDPFGSVTIRDGGGVEIEESAIENDLLFLSAPHFQSMELSHLGARMFDTRMGRFVSEDPLQWAGGEHNLYNYAGNNPYRWADPSGLSRLDTQDPNPWAVTDSEGGWRPRPTTFILDGILEQRPGILGIFDVSQGPDGEINPDWVKLGLMENLAEALLDEAAKFVTSFGHDQVEKFNELETELQQWILDTLYGELQQWQEWGYQTGNLGIAAANSNMEWAIGMHLFHEKWLEGVNRQGLYIIGAIVAQAVAPFLIAEAIVAGIFIKIAAGVQALAVKLGGALATLGGALVRFGGALRTLGGQLASGISRMAGTFRNVISFANTQISLLTYRVLVLRDKVDAWLGKGTFKKLATKIVKTTVKYAWKIVFGN